MKVSNLPILVYWVFLLIYSRGCCVFVCFRVFCLFVFVLAFVYFCLFLFIIIFLCLFFLSFFFFFFCVCVLCVFFFFGGGIFFLLNPVLANLNYSLVVIYYIYPI